MSTELKIADRQVEPVEQSRSLINVIAQAAADKDMDVAKLRELIDLQRGIVAEQARVAFEQAMVLAQEEMPGVVRDAMNDHTRSRYARLETIDLKIRPVYTRHGFSLSFDGQTQADRSIEVTCIVSHRDGHTRTYKLAGDLDATGSQGKANKTPIQAMGSTVSYLRRYLTCMIFNIVLTNEDRDGSPERLPEGNISAEQKEEIVKLLRATGTDPSRFLEYVGAPTLDEMPASKYAPAVAALRRKIAAKRDVTVFSKQKDPAQ